jgi:hypothetical protein
VHSSAKGLAEGFAAELEAYTPLISTEDRREALKAFAEKRLPNWKGKSLRPPVIPFEVPGGNVGSGPTGPTRLSNIDAPFIMDNRAVTHLRICSG